MSNKTKSSYRYRRSLVKNVSPEETAQISYLRVKDLQLSEGNIGNPQELVTLKQDPSSLLWVKFIGKISKDTLATIHDNFSIDRSYLEEILDRVNKPKVENFDHYHVLTLKSILGLAHESGDIRFNPVCLYLEKNFVLSFSENDDNFYNQAKEKIKTHCQKKKDYTASDIYHRLIDCLFDEYYDLAGSISAQIELFSKESASQERRFITKLLQLRKNILVCKKELLPMRESLGKLSKSDDHEISYTTRKHLKDTYENTQELYEGMEHFKELVDNILYLHNAQMNSSTNRVFKDLTIFAAIFAPITFIAGVYGMNFRHIPELEWKYGYMFSWILFFLTSVVTIIYFKRRKWI